MLLVLCVKVLWKVKLGQGEMRFLYQIFLSIVICKLHQNKLTISHMLKSNGQFGCPRCA